MTLQKIQLVNYMAILISNYSNIKGIISLQISVPLQDVASVISKVIPYKKNIGKELNLANWRIKIKSPIFYFANIFCTRLTQNFARDPSAVAVI